MRSSNDVKLPRVSHVARARSGLLGYLVAVGLVAGSTALFVLGRPHFAKGQWALLYLLVISLVAGIGGVGPAVLAAVLAFFTWNFFLLPPYHTLAVSDPKDWLSLVVFLVVGTAMGIQTGRMRERESEAMARERDTALLNRFSAYLVSEVAVEDMGRFLLREVREAAGAAYCALFLMGESGVIADRMLCPDETGTLDPAAVAIAEWVVREAKAVGLSDLRQDARAAGVQWPISASYADAGADERRMDLFLPMLAAEHMGGVLHVGPRADGMRYGTSQARLLVALTNQAAAFLERQRLHERAVQADALREAERLKSALLSSVSHELKTPLASVTATVTNLLEPDLDWDAKATRSELESIRGDLERLNDSINSLVDLSRLAGEDWQPEREWYEFGEVVSSVVAKLPPGQRERVEFSLPEELPQIRVDFAQWAIVFQHLIENALVYGGEDSPVEVGAAADSDEVRMWVADKGPGVPPEEQEMIFEKFQRGSASARAPSGTGLGLTIAREIARFHGGKIEVQNLAPRGAMFVVCLPREEP